MVQCNELLSSCQLDSQRSSKIISLCVYIDQIWKRIQSAAGTPFRRPDPMVSITTLRLDWCANKVCVCDIGTKSDMRAITVLGVAGIYSWVVPSCMRGVAAQDSLCE